MKIMCVIFFSQEADYPVDILEAFRANIYKRSFFDSLDELRNIPPECVMTDDIWISAYLSRRGIPRVKLIQGWGDTAEFSENDKIAPLRSNNLNGTRLNDVCAVKLLDSFQMGWSARNRYDEFCSFDFSFV
jgi:hypothetical protein